MFSKLKMGKNKSGGSLLYLSGDLFKKVLMSYM